MRTGKHIRIAFRTCWLFWGITTVAHGQIYPHTDTFTSETANLNPAASATTGSPGSQPTGLVANIPATSAAQPPGNDLWPAPAVGTTQHDSFLDEPLPPTTVVPDGIVEFQLPNDQPVTWIQAGVLLWSPKGYNVPALITESPTTTTAGQEGVLGLPTTKVLFGNDRLGDDLLVGGRLKIGRWYDGSRSSGFQVDLFGLGGSNTTTFRTSDSTGWLARPFFNTDIDEQDAQVFSKEGLANGSVEFETSSHLVSSSPALRWNLLCHNGMLTDCTDHPTSLEISRFDFLLGYRYLHLEEEFEATEILNVEHSHFVAGTQYRLYDDIETENHFHGLEFGLDYLYRRGAWYCELSSALALGQIKRSVNLDGTTSYNVPGLDPSVSNGGFFVESDEIGRWQDDEFGTITHVQANVGYDLGRNWRLGAGYNFLFVDAVYRPGDYIDTQINGAQLGLAASEEAVTRRPQIKDSRAYFHGANISMSHSF